MLSARGYTLVGGVVLGLVFWYAVLRGISLSSKAW